MSSSFICSLCATSFQRCDIYNHVQEYHVGSRIPDSLFDISCGDCSFKCSELSGARIIEHMSRTKHRTSEMRLLWTTVMSKEAERVAEVVENGIRLLKENLSGILPSESGKQSLPTEVLPTMANQIHPKALPPRFGAAYERIGTTHDVTVGGETKGRRNRTIRDNLHVVQEEEPSVDENRCDEQPIENGTNPLRYLKFESRAESESSSKGALEGCLKTENPSLESFCDDDSSFSFDAGMEIVQNPQRKTVESTMEHSLDPSEETKQSPQTYAGYSSSTTQPYSSLQRLSVGSLSAFREISPQEPISDAQVKCFLCEKAFKAIESNGVMLRHFTSTHSEVDILKCTMCSRQFRSGRHFCHHREKFRCGGLKMSLRSPDTDKYFRKHLSVCFPGTDFERDIRFSAELGFIFNRSAFEPVKAGNRAQNVGKHDCHICQGKGTQKMKTMKIYHAITHSNLKLYQCNGCPARFTRPATLKFHKKTRTKTDKCDGTYVTIERKVDIANLRGWLKKCYPSFDWDTSIPVGRKVCGLQF